MYNKLQYGFVQKNEISDDIRDEVKQLFLEAIDLYEKSKAKKWLNIT